MTKQEELDELVKLYNRRQAACDRVSDRCNELLEQLNDEHTHLAMIHAEMHRLSAQIAALKSDIDNGK